MTKYRLTFLLLLLVSLAVEAKVVLPPHFSSNMVVQRNSVMTIEGTSRAQCEVVLKASWHKKPVKAMSDKEGRFCIKVRTPKAGGPHTMVFCDGEETVLENVLSGEVWLGSGQSNMEMPMAGWGKVLNYEEEIANADFTSIRLLTIKKTTSLKPLDECEVTDGGWQVCSPSTVENFSALGYFFALRLWEELGVPVGIINASWGGTPCESWVSAEELTKVTGFEERMNKVLELNQDAEKVAKHFQYEHDDFAKLERATDEGERQKWYSPDFDDSQWKTINLPGKWESEIGEFDGVVWLRRTVEVPDSQASRDLPLDFGRFDDAGRIYWNGTLIGETFNAQQFATFTVPAPLVKAGTNHLCIRINDLGGAGGTIGEKMSFAGTYRYSIGYEMSELPPRPVEVNDRHFPSVLWNAMIHPLRHFPVKGVIWYQGCDNVGRADQYAQMFPALIKDWRKRFGNEKMPFLFMQLANYLAQSDIQPESEWALLRESQAEALHLPHTGMVVNIDLGDAKDIHPKTKRETARRLSALALSRVYGKKVECQAPIYNGFSVEGNAFRIHFSLPNGAEPLMQEADVKGFIVKGEDGLWHIAKAYTNGNDVIVSNDEVLRPVAVRYGWADNPACSLRTKSGFRVAPFRSDK